LAPPLYNGVALVQLNLTYVITFGAHFQQKSRKKLRLTVKNKTARQTRQPAFPHTKPPEKNNHRKSQAFVA